MHSLRRHFRPSQKEIGRASCRERGEISVGAVSFKKKKGNTRWNCDWSSDVCSSDLLADKDKPVLVFDSCIHSGDTLDPVKKRSEERRVGKEGRSRWAPYHLKKKKGIRDGTVTGVQTCALPIFLLTKISLFWFLIHAFTPETL